MRKNSDSHLKIRTVTVKKRFGELPQVLRRCKKKLFGWGIFGFSNRGSQARGPLMNCFVLWGFSNSFPYPIVIHYYTLLYTIIHYYTLLYYCTLWLFSLSEGNKCLDNVEAHWLQRWIKKGEIDEKASYFLFSTKNLLWLANYKKPNQERRNRQESLWESFSSFLIFGDHKKI